MPIGSSGRRDSDGRGRGGSGSHWRRLIPNTHGHHVGRGSLVGGARAGGGASARRCPDAGTALARGGATGAGLARAPHRLVGGGRGALLAASGQTLSLQAERTPHGGDERLLYDEHPTRFHRVAAVHASHRVVWQGTRGRSDGGAAPLLPGAGLRAARNREDDGVVGGPRGGAPQAGGEAPHRPDWPGGCSCRLGGARPRGQSLSDPERPALSGGASALPAAGGDPQRLAIPRGRRAAGAPRLRSRRSGIAPSGEEGSAGACPGARRLAHRAMPRRGLVVAPRASPR